MQKEEVKKEPVDYYDPIMITLLITVKASVISPPVLILPLLRIC